MQKQSLTRLIPAEPRHVAELRCWFTDRQSLQSWGGPHFRFPFDAESFAHDAALDRMDSFALLDEHDAMLGFGQYYAKLSRVHLSRVGVHPDRRGAGLGQTLVRKLMQTGREKCGFHEYSLYVMADNPAAIACYRRSGFQPADLPLGESHGPGILFMICRPG